MPGLDDSKSALGLRSVNDTVNSINSNITRLAGTIENTLLPKVRAVAQTMGGINQGLVHPTTGQSLSTGNRISDPGPAAGQSTGINQDGTKDNRVFKLPDSLINALNFGRQSIGGVSGAISTLSGTVAGQVAAATAGAMPNVPTAVAQDYLTNRAAFYGFGGDGSPLGIPTSRIASGLPLSGLAAQTAKVRALQNLLAKMGTPTSAMDTTNAIINAQAAGFGGATNFNQVMQGIAQASNLEPGMGMGQIASAMGAMNAPTTVNMARTIGINIRQPDGSVLPFPQLVDKIWAFISQQSGGRGMDKKSIQYSLMPGYGIYNLISGLFNGDPAMIKMVSDALLAKASFGGEAFGNITQAQMVKAGIQSSTVRAIGAQNAAQTGFLTSTSSAISGGYAASLNADTTMTNFTTALNNFTKIFSIFGSANSLVSGILNIGGGFLSKIFGLFKADGGQVGGSSPYIVGERGPELFVPKSDGVIVPNHLLGNPHRQNGGPVKNGGDIVKFLMQQGFSKSGATGIAANLNWESGFNTEAAGDMNASGQYTSFGLAQWHDSRWNDLQRFATNSNLDINDPKTQLLFLTKELGQKQYASLTKELKGNVNAQKATQDFLSLYERAADTSSAAALKRYSAFNPNKSVTEQAMSGYNSNTGTIGSIPSGLLSGQNSQATSNFWASVTGQGGAGAGTNYNYGGVVINITATDPKSTADAVSKALTAKGIQAKVGKA